MKIAAHPVMVAVALGLLGPGAIEGANDSASPEVAVSGVDPDEQARAEKLWRDAREAFDAERDDQA